MGNNKVSEELVMTVRSVVGQDISDMDIIRSLHMAKNDVTAAINIIFDIPDFSTRDRVEIVKNPETSTRNSKSDCTTTVLNSYSLDSDANGNPNLIPQTNSISELQISRKSASSTGSEWWFVGSSELAGLSTCKGRRLTVGEEVNFSFPLKKSNSPSTGKVLGRGKPASACSEIVRFSTKDSGEVCFLIHFVFVVTVILVFFI